MVQEVKNKSEKYKMNVFNLGNSLGIAAVSPTVYSVFVPSTVASRSPNKESPALCLFPIYTAFISHNFMC